MNWTALISGALVLAVHLPTVSTAAERDVYFDRRGDYLRARYHHLNALYWGRGDRAVRFVPTAYYRTDDYFIAMAYRPAPRGPWWAYNTTSYKAPPGTVIEKRASAFRYSGSAANNYRLSLPATYNDSIAYHKTVIPISRVKKPAARVALVAPPAPAPTPAPAAPEPAPAIEPAPEPAAAAEPAAQSPVEPATAESALEPSTAQPEISPDASPFPNPTPVLRQQ